MDKTKPKWTPSQQTAIDALCADNLVSAAAGSGKTAVMVERIISRVIKGEADIDKLLIVTFTNAAAAELKSRLMSKIMDALDEGDSDRLNRQLVLINNAQICTIDSFCLNVIKNNFYRLNLDPAIKIGDSAEIELLKRESLTEIFDEYYEKQDEEFLNLVDCYTKKNDSELFDLILSIFKFTNSLPKGVGELKELSEKFYDDSLWKDYFVKKAHNLAEKGIKFYNMAISKAEQYESFSKVYLQLIDERNNYVLVSERNNWDDIKKVVDNFSFPTLNFPRGTSDEEKNPVKLPREAGKKLREEFQEIFSQDLEILSCDIECASKSMEKLIALTEEFEERFLQKKKEKNMVDFVDIEHMTLSLLCDEKDNQSELAVTLMQKYDEIYVDEYQDCNSVQEKIFSLISRKHIGKPNIFMVGDMKQSIYGFRGSEPGLFKEKASKYPLYDGKSLFNKIILSKNFRSTKSVIDGVNSIFSQIMTEDFELRYTKEEYLNYNEDSSQSPNEGTEKIDIVMIETSNDEIDRIENDADNLEELKGIEAEAIFVANKINSMVLSSDSKPYLVYDKALNDYRNIRYSDIVILLRSGGEKAEIFNRILTSAEIPAYCDMGEGFFDTPEVDFLISFLKIIDNPFDDVAFLTVMRHPVIGFNDDDFVSIRLSKPKGYFYFSVKEYVKQNQNELASKLEDFLKSLNSFYDKSKYLPTDKLLWDIITHTEYMSYIAFQSNSDLRKANVNALITRAYDFEKTSYKGVFDFIRYVDTLKKSDKDIEPAKTLSDDEDVVRIMTIHKSKGLEFPVVFLSGSAKKFNDMDIRTDKLLIDKDYGFGLNFYDYSNRYYYELPQKKLIKDVKYRKMLSEEMRVLYVALTRAREKLIITGSDRKVLLRISNLCDKIKYEDKEFSADVISLCKSYSDWILLSVLRNKELVSDLKLNENATEIVDGSKFTLKIIPKNNQILNVAPKGEKRNITELSIDKETLEKITKILDYKYPRKALSDIASNLSVTELKRLNNNDDVFEYYHTSKLSSPKFFDDEQKLSGADIGTITHLVMEKLDFSKADSPEDIKTQIEGMVIKGFLTDAMAKSVNYNNIHKILSTDVGKRMKNHTATLKREFGFKYLVKASKIFTDITEDEDIVVQGMIDAFFEDDDGALVIIDYKTDKINGNIDEVVKRYTPQLKYYKSALETALDKKVGKTYLMFTDIGEAVEVKV